MRCTQNIISLVSTSSRLLSIWHPLLTLQEDLHIKNRASESHRDTRRTFGRRHPRFKGPLMMTISDMVV